MENFDLVFKKVNILKNIYWFVIFLAVTFGMFFMIITPAIKDYRVKNLDLKDSLTNVLNYQKEYEAYHKELVKLKDENKNILIAFSNKYMEDKILSAINRHFKSMKIIQKKVDESDKEFIKYEFLVSTQVNSPMSFYKLVDDLNKLSNIVEIDFPIEFSRNSDNIENNFIIRIFELKEKNKKF